MLVHSTLLAVAAIAALAATATLLLEVLNMAQIDDLNTAVGVLAQSVADLSAEVASIQPAAPVDLSGAIAGVQAASAGVAQAVTDLKTKLPSA